MIFFNASTRLQGMSLNAGYSLITSWAASLQGVPVIHFVCNHGMPYCMFGSILNDPTDKPPCDICTGQSRKLFQNSNVRKFQYNPPRIIASISQCSLDELIEL